MIPDAPAGVPVGYLSVAAVVLCAVGLMLLIAGVAALLRARPLRFTLRSLLGLLLLAVGVLAAAIGVGVRGYEALTQEEVAARIVVRPTAPQRFEASFRFADGSVGTYELAGDEIYVDAYILKWKPVAQFLGLHTLWTLDRVSGRYRSIEQERGSPRTLHALGAQRPVDLFELRRRFASLAPLYDAEYGSASFVPANEPAQFELRVTASGLIIRRMPDKG